VFGGGGGGSGFGAEVKAVSVEGRLVVVEVAVDLEQK